MSGEIRITSKRNIGLDLLRIGLAILIYMFHSNMHLYCQYGIFTHFAQMGAIAMTGFFMMSGYALNFSNKEVLTDISSYKKFMIKRLVSILPLYYFVALVYILLMNKESWQSLLLLFPFEVLGLQSCFTSLFGVSHNGGTWFISCLMICYILFPFIQWLLLRISKRSKIALGGGIFCILVLSSLLQRHFNLASIYANPFFRMLEFTMGVLAYMMGQEIRSEKIMKMLKSKFLLLFCVALLVAGVSVGDIMLGENVRDFMLMNIVAIPCFFLIFLSMGYVSFNRLSDCKIVTYGSKLSYAFFLAQFFVFPLSYHLVAYWIGIDTNIMRIMVSFVVCFCISFFLHEAIEKPSAKLLIKR